MTDRKPSELVTKARSVQLSAFPDLQPDKPISAILPSVVQGTNADLMAAVAPFYLTGSVCDLTYGEGKWWTKFRPDPFVAHDLHKLDGVDFTALPEPDDTYDAVCFDPPYIPQGGVGTSTVAGFRDGFGLESRSRAGLWAMIEGGLFEAGRVVRPGGWVLVKCMDFVNGGAFCAWSFDIKEAAGRFGLPLWDSIVHHAGAGPGGWNIFDPIRARRHHSMLLVFRKP